MNVKQVITTLKKAETVPEYTSILQKISNSQFAGSTAADSRDLNNCITTIFEKSLINNSETDHEILLTFLSYVPTLLTRSRGKIFKFLAETFHPEIWANLFRTTAPSKQSGEWQKMLKDCVEVIEDIYNQVMSGVPNSEILIQAESSLQVKDIRMAGECLNFLIKSRPKGTFLNLTEMVGLITDCKKSYFSEFMRSALLKTLIDETPRLHLGRVRTVIFNYLVKAKDYSGLALILLKFGSIVSVDLFRLNEDEFSILDVYKSEKEGSREFLQKESGKIIETATQRDLGLWVFNCVGFAGTFIFRIFWKESFLRENNFSRLVERKYISKEIKVQFYPFKKEDQ